jgi:hypothetical protein
MRAANNQHVKPADMTFFTDLVAEKTRRLPNRPLYPRLQIPSASNHAEDFHNRALASGRDGREDIA